jgi:cold shock CspA family protein
MGRKLYVGNLPYEVGETEAAAGSETAIVGENRAGRTVMRPSRLAGQKAARGRASQPAERRGAASTGRIVKLLLGHGHGFIRIASGREIFFHRSDLEDRIAFNDFAVGDPVSFELLEDAVSGARALKVKQRGRSQ